MVLTLDQLKRRVRSLASRWYLCENEEEATKHLLVHCQQARMLWEITLAIVGTSWVYPLHGKELGWERNPRKCGRQCSVICMYINIGIKTTKSASVQITNNIVAFQLETQSIELTGKNWFKWGLSTLATKEIHYLSDVIDCDDD